MTKTGMAGAAIFAIATLALAASEASRVSASTPATTQAVPVAKPARATVVAKLAPAPAPAPAPATATAPAPAAASDYVIKRVLKIDGPMRHGDHVWDEAGVPAGPIIVTVDLAAQTMSVFRGGYEIGAAVILYGADAKPTPLGVYPVTQKDMHHVSNIYHAPMPYMLRLTNDGISIHASDVQDGYMTHGCIGVPTAFAKRLFAAIKLGDRVIVTRGEMLKTGEAITAA